MLNLSETHAGVFSPALTPRPIDQAPMAGLSHLTRKPFVRNNLDVNLIVAII
jgi:hypothetical protein